MKNILAGICFIAIMSLSLNGICAQTEAKEVVEGEKVMISKGKTIKMDYVLTVDGHKMDSSEGAGPLEYVHGEGKIIPGLEKELEGLIVGAQKTVMVFPEDGYGPVRPEAYQEVPKSEFPPDIPLKAGSMIGVGGPDGQQFPAVISEVKEEVIVLDLNHPLAGKELKFEVTIVDIQ